MKEPNVLCQGLDLLSFPQIMEELASNGIDKGVDIMSEMTYIKIKWKEKRNP